MGLKLVRIGGPSRSPAYLFLTSCGDMTPPHPAGDLEGPPFHSPPLSPLRMLMGLNVN